MALPTGAVWEVRTTGTIFNGGFWNDRGGASTDYSQQDGAEAIWTNLSTDGLGTLITDADAGGFFTAAMVGNGFRIEGVWYEMVTYLSGNNCMIDRSAGSIVSGQGGRIGGAVDDPSRIASSVVAGNTIHIESGTYNMLVAFTSTVGTFANPILWIGYNATRGDEPAPSSGNQPILACGASNSATFSDFNKVSFVDFTVALGTIVLGKSAIAFKCKSYNSSGSAAQEAFLLSSVSAVLMSCEAISDNGPGIVATAAGPRIIYCYAHDCDDYGIDVSASDYYTVLSNILDANNLAGIYCGGASYGGTVMFNTIDGQTANGIDVSPATDGIDVIMNNQITNNGNYGLAPSGGMAGDLLDYNNWYLNSTGDINIASKGDHPTANDPGYANRGAGNFSNVNNKNALGMELGVG